MERCVIDSQQIDELKLVLDELLQVDLQRSVLRAIYCNSEILDQVRDYGARDEIVLQNALYRLQEVLLNSKREFTSEELQQANDDFLS